MEIYYCSKCEGRPYTLKLDKGIVCPVCGTTLRSEDVNEDSLDQRPLIYKDSKNSLKLNFKISHDNPETNEQNKFTISSGEKFYIYLGVNKTGKYDFSCFFILGNVPDTNGVVSKVPVISSPFSFTQRIEMTELERYRIIFEKAVTGHGWETDEMQFHLFYLQNDEEKSRITVPLELSDEIVPGREAEIYFIDYMIPSYGDIQLFGKNRMKFLDSVMDVHDRHNEGYMKSMFFRAKNGDTILELASFALSSAVLFDDPYTDLLRYDRILKEMKMPRI